ncbi:MAG: hypothetical protein ABIJ18_03280 [archaeon]
MNQIQRSGEKTIQGRLSYSESSQGWSILRLKKEVLNEFKTLKEKRNPSGYKLVLFDNYEQAESHLKKIKETCMEPPVFLVFERL